MEDKGKNEIKWIDCRISVKALIEHNKKKGHEGSLVTDKFNVRPNKHYKTEKGLRKALESIAVPLNLRIDDWKVIK